jgi:hypothetical protein
MKDTPYQLAEQKIAEALKTGAMELADTMTSGY